MEPVTGLLARSIHLLSSILLVGGAATLLLAGQSDRPTTRRWEGWVLRICTVCVLIALASALVAVAAQAALLEGRASAAVEPGTAAAIAVDVLHLAAAGVWVGGLLPLALLLRLASREDGADARPYAVLAARRFSRAALAIVLVLIATGSWSTWLQVGSV